MEPILIRGESTLDEFEIASDGHQEIVEVVSDASGQLTDRLHPLGPGHGGFLLGTGSTGSRKLLRLSQKLALHVGGKANLNVFLVATGAIKSVQGKAIPMAPALAARKRNHPAKTGNAIKLS
jgi:hypothetical protein